VEGAAVGRGDEGEHRDVSLRVSVDRDRIADFCRRWKVTEFTVFGSVVRDDFRPDSDIDVLVTFAPNATWNAFDIVEMKEALEALLARRLDMVERGAVRNPIRIGAMLRDSELIHAA
jgi:hypothetical protein